MLFARSPKTKSPLYKYLLKDLSLLFNNSIFENKVDAKSLKEMADLHDCEYVFYIKNKELIVSKVQSKEEILKFNILQINTIENVKSIHNCALKGKMAFYAHNIEENIKNIFTKIVETTNKGINENTDKILSLISYDNLIYLRFHNSEGNEIGPRMVIESIKNNL